MLKLGFVGWRGMVGRVLLEQMRQQNDVAQFAITFFSTSQAGSPAPSVAGHSEVLQDAYDLDALRAMAVIVSCQGSAYTQQIHAALRAAGWTGYWVDAASHLRMQDASMIVLDPINGEAMDAALKAGQRDFIGGNCTVSLMLLSLAGLLEQDAIEWVSVMTYQAVSGAGAQAMAALIEQMRDLSQPVDADYQSDPLALEAMVTQRMRSPSHPSTEFGAPLAGSLIPWIDSAVSNGQTREEWKAQAEASKILQRPCKVDGICVRMGALRSHSQGLTFKLKSTWSESALREALHQAHQWVHVVDNTAEATRTQLTPAAVTGTLDIPIGRIRPSQLGENMWHAFTVGDQLLWGAAEPLRHALTRIRQHHAAEI